MGTPRSRLPYFIIAGAILISGAAGIHQGAQATVWVAELSSPILYGGYLLVALATGCLLLFARARRRAGDASVAALERSIKDLASAAEYVPDPVHIPGVPPAVLTAINDCLRTAQAYIDAAKNDKLEVLTQSKILGYQKSRLEAVLEALPDGVAVLDQTGVCTFLNGKMNTLTGLVPEHIRGKKIHEWCPAPEMQTRLSRQSDGSLQVLRVEHVEFTSPRSPDLTLLLSAYPLFNAAAHQSSNGTLLTCRDITSEALAKRARSDFVAHVSHELKSPLNILSMYGEMLMNNGDDASIRVEATNVIRDEVERLATLINNLLSVTKIEMGSISLDRKRVKFREFLQDIYSKVIRDATQSDLKTSIHLPPDMSAVYVDKDLLGIAISNLLTNAIKYNRPGGTVDFIAHETDDQFLISVKDSGIGIGPEDLAKIYDKFFRSEHDEVRKRSGHGLGLALAKQIFDLHHGLLKVESTLGVGTEFTLTFHKSPTLMKQTL